MNLKPVTELQISRRNLPHLEIPGSLYFITFRTVHGFSLSEIAKDIVFESIKFHSGKKYELNACVVMTDHSHMLIKPAIAQARTPVPPVPDAAYYSLAQIMHSVKGYSAKRILKVTSRKGGVWLDENYDRIIRDESEYSEKLNYIAYNPVKAGLVEKPEDYKWLYIMD